MHRQPDPRSSTPPSLPTRFVAAVLLCAATGATIQAQGTDPDVGAERLKRLVSSLCTVETVGRRMASPGYLVAAAVVAKELERAGVTPGGEDGFYQPLPLKRFFPEALEEGGTVGAARFYTREAAGVVTTFELGRDFELPLDGNGTPPPNREFPLLVVTSSDELPEEADPGVALIFTPSVPIEERMPLLASKGQSVASWGLYLQGRSHLQGRRIRVTKPQLEIDFGSDQPGDPVSVKGPLRELLHSGVVETVRVASKWRVADVACANVVGIVPGVGTSERPELKDEVIVLTAHLDHLGLDRKARGGLDRVYDGANNNASGVAALIEVAAALVSEPPARTVLFVFATGGEAGLRGIRYQILHPSLPLSRTIYALDVDSIGKPDPRLGKGSLWLTAWVHTVVGPAWQQRDLPIAMDERPKMSFQGSAGTWRYVLEGIPGQSISSASVDEDWNTPRDEPQTLDYDHMLAATENLIRAVRILVDGEIDPRN